MRRWTIPLLLVGVSACHQPSAGAKASAEISDAELNAGHLDVLSDLSRLPAPTARSTFAAKDGMALAYEVYLNPANKGNVVMISGYTESYVLYAEMLADFYSHGYSLFIMDNRGMGKSGRDPRLSSPLIVSVDSIDDYVADEEDFIAKIVAPAIATSAQPAAKLLLWAHSTGGLIGAKLLARNPSLFHRAVLNCPLLAMRTQIPLASAKQQVGQAVAAGFGLSYIGAPAQPTFDINAFTYATNITTHSLAASAKARRP